MPYNRYEHAASTTDQADDIDNQDVLDGFGYYDLDANELDELAWHDDPDRLLDMRREGDI